MLFEKDKVCVRKLEDKDKYDLVKWLSDPEVLEFYEGRDNPFDIEKVDKAFYDAENKDEGCIVEFERKPIGYIQYYQVDNETKYEYGYKEERVFGMDQFIGEPTYWNKGIGQILVTAMVDYLLKEKQAGIVVMDPQAWNNRAIRCYEKCGFKKIKPLPSHEYHEGEYRDCWLIEYRK